MKRVMAHIGFSVATTLFALNIFGYKYAIIMAVVCGILTLFSILLKKTRQAVVVPICFGSALLACLLFIIVVNGTYLPEQKLDNQTSPTIFQIVDLPEETENGYSYTVKTSKICCDGTPQNIKLKLYSKEKINAEPYDYIKCNVSFHSIGKSSIESYGYFSDNIFLFGSVYGTVQSETNTHKNFNYQLLKLRTHIKEVITSSLNGDYGGVALALIIGDKSGINSSTLDCFKTIGVTHLMAISGLHTSLWAGIIYFALKKLRLPESVRALGVITILLCYCSLAGFSKSVVRSVIMVSVMLIGRVINKRSDTLNSLGTAVFIICLNPFAAVDVSAVMSVLATLSILTLRPKVYWSLYNKIHINRYSKQIVMKILNGIIIAVSVSLYTFPASYIFFGYISILGLITNLIFVPLGTVTMVLSSVLVIVSKIKFVGYCVAYLTGLSSKIMIVLAKAFSRLPIGIINVDNIVIPFIIAGVLILFALAIKMNKTAMLKVAAICSAILIIISVTFSYYISKDYVYLKVFQTDGTVAVAIQSRNNIAIIGAGDKSAYYEEKNLAYSLGGDCSMLLLPTYNNDSKYANDLASATNVNELVVPYDDGITAENISAKNICPSRNLSVDLWNTVNVKYKYVKENYSVLITIYDKTILIYSGVDMGVSSVDLLLLPKGQNCSMAYRKAVTFGKLYNQNSNIATTEDGTITFTIDKNKELVARRDINWGELAKLN